MKRKTILRICKKFPKACVQDRKTLVLLIKRQIHMRYERPWMYDAISAWPTQSIHLRGVNPQILHLNLTSIGISMPAIAGPPSLGAPARARVFNTFNPSIVRAPRRLRAVCARCSYVVALRADPLHQCNASSPLLQSNNKKPIPSGSWFKGTVLAVLDSSLKLVRWTWLLMRPEDQIAIVHNTSRWFVKPGMHDDYTSPPWSKPSYDTRLIVLNDEELFATTNCKACTFAAARVEVTGMPSSDGGARSEHII